MSDRMITLDLSALTFDELDVFHAMMAAAEAEARLVQHKAEDELDAMLEIEHDDERYAAYCAKDDELHAFRVLADEFHALRFEA